ncbi:transcription termination/antitermination NusG family protein [Tianweitania sediminis]|uniref:NusG-like N-terminal domain-containing protein n=1 Tax=Tianweitania sediminis TaxID=1502156 RepID=A0A8J7R4L5_9HYPH|nr:transcription termination/antitermination NusG family protein [Tianweitania sediminis]MBP0440671.1 hypothetical protein [Tianweitania sediminis]
MPEVSTPPPWYVARLKPGASRTARHRIGLPEWRHNETIAERSLRDCGFTVYFPKMRKDIIHHRTRVLITREFPLFTGYLFVDRITSGPVSARDCDGVAELMGVKTDGRPWPVPAAVVTRFQQAEQDELFDDTKSARIKREEEGRTERETIMMKFPAGLPIRIENPRHILHGFHGRVVSVTGRGLVKVMVATLQSLTPVQAEFLTQDLETAW